MPPKAKKPKSKAKRRGVKKMTTAEYVAAIADAKQQLQELCQQQIPLEKKAIEMEVKFRQQREDFNDIKAYLNYELQNEQNTIKIMDENVEYFGEQLLKQMDHFGKLFDEKSQVIEGYRNEQRHKIDELTETLQIFNNFEQQRNEINTGEKELLVEENKFKVRQSKEIEEFEKQMRSEQTELEKEMNEHLENIGKTVKKMTDENSPEVANTDPRILQDAYEKLCVKYVETIQKHEAISREKYYSDLEMDLLNERLALIQKEDQKGCAKSKIENALENEDSETGEEANSTQKLRKQSRKFQNLEYEGFIENILLELIGEAIEEHEDEEGNDMIENGNCSSLESSEAEEILESSSPNLSGRQSSSKVARGSQPNKPGNSSQCDEIYGENLEGSSPAPSGRQSSSGDDRYSQPDMLRKKSPHSKEITQEYLEGSSRFSGQAQRRQPNKPGENSQSNMTGKGSPQCEAISRENLEDSRTEKSGSHSKEKPGHQPNMPGENSSEKLEEDIKELVFQLSRLRGSFGPEDSQMGKMKKTVQLSQTKGFGAKSARQLITAKESANLNGKVLRKVLDGIGRKVNEALSITGDETSMKGEQEEIYTRVEEILEELSNMVEDFWKHEEEMRRLDKEMATPDNLLSPKPRERQILVKHAKFYRHELYKNWRTPKDRSIRLLTVLGKK